MRLSRGFKVLAVFSVFQGFRPFEISRGFRAILEFSSSFGCFWGFWKVSVFFRVLGGFGVFLVIYSAFKSFHRFQVVSEFNVVSGVSSFWDFKGYHWIQAILIFLGGMMFLKFWYKRSLNC